MSTIMRMHASSKRLNEATECVLLDSPAALTRFKEKLRAPQPLPPATIRLGPAIVPASQRLAVEERLNALYSDCGCTAGSLAAAAAAVASAWRLVRSRGSVEFSDGAQSAGMIIVAALLGKGLALAYQRATLIRFLTRLGSNTAEADRGTGFYVDLLPGSTGEDRDADPKDERALREEEV